MLASAASIIKVSQNPEERDGTEIPLLRERRSELGRWTSVDAPGVDAGYTDQKQSLEKIVGSAFSACIEVCDTSPRDFTVSGER